MSIGRLIRKLDQDLIARILNKVPRPVEPAKRVKPIRVAGSYRAARRNKRLRADRGVWRGTGTGYAGAPAITLNRSANWRRAKSYKHARTISPVPHVPVR